MQREIQEGNKLIAEGNKLIAEFMKSDSLPHRYDTDWNWLMPVIKEIGKYGLAYEQANKMWRISIMIDIGALWAKCVEFIQWYNEHSK